MEIEGKGSENCMKQEEGKRSKDTFSVT